MPSSQVGFEMRRFRTFFRLMRERAGMGRDKLAQRAGVGKATIQSLETDTDATGLETAAKLIEALPGETLSGFFRKFEDSANNRLSQSSCETERPTVVLTARGHGRQIRDLAERVRILHTSREESIHAE